MGEREGDTTARERLGVQAAMQTSGRLQHYYSGELCGFSLVPV